MFVTGLSFLPVKNSNQGPTISSNSELAVLSISIDNKICIHSVQNRHTIPVWLSILLIIFVLFLTFVILSYIGI
uniref:Uncharacterized protein n=1 Tax=Megaselia scalaris TaxID=36166 RepID=T1GDZ6_MEGSC